MASQVDRYVNYRELSFISASKEVKHSYDLCQYKLVSIADVVSLNPRYQGFSTWGFGILDDNGQNKYFCIFQGRRNCYNSTYYIIVG